MVAIVVLLAALVVAQQPLLDAEICWRRDAVLDPLSGLYEAKRSGRNRVAFKHSSSDLAATTEDKLQVLGA